MSRPSTINPHTHEDNGPVHSRPSLGLVQSEIVIAVVLGGIFLSLIIVNIVFGTVLLAEEKKDKRRRQRKESGQRPNDSRVPNSPQNKDLNTGPQTEGRRYRGHNNKTDSIPQSNDVIDSHNEKDTYQFQTPTPRYQDEIEDRSNQSPINSEEDLSSHSIDHITNIPAANLAGFEPQCPVRLVTYAYNAGAIRTEADGAMTSRAPETAEQDHDENILAQTNRQQHDSKNDELFKTQSSHYEDVKDTRNNSNLQPGGHNVTSEGTTKDADKVGSNHSKGQMTSQGSLDSMTFDLDPMMSVVNTDNKHAREQTKEDIELNVYEKKDDRLKNSAKEATLEGQIHNDPQITEPKTQSFVIPSQENAKTYKNTRKKSHVGRDDVILEVEEPESCEEEADSSRGWIPATQTLFVDIHDQQEVITIHNQQEVITSDIHNQQEVITSDIHNQLEVITSDIHNHQEVITSDDMSGNDVLDIMCISDDAQRSYFPHRHQTCNSDQRETREESTTNIIVVTDASGIEPRPSTPLTGESPIPTTPVTRTDKHTRVQTILTESAERKTPINKTTNPQTKTTTAKTSNKSMDKTHTTDNIPHRLFNRPDKKNKDKTIIKSSKSDNNITTEQPPKRLEDFLLLQENKREKISKKQDDHRYFTAYGTEVATTGQHFVKKSQTSTRFNLHFNPSYYTVQSRLLSTQRRTPNASTTTRVPHDAADPVSPTATQFLHTSGPVTPFPRSFALPPMTSLYTLSEEDLKTYPDTSIPTIDELVRNDAAKKRHLATLTTTRDILGAHRIEPSINADSDETGLKPHPKRTNLHKTTKHDPSNPHKGSKKDSNDMIGFHTGVSDHFHSVSLQRDSSLHRQLKSQIIKKPDESAFRHDVQTTGNENELFEQNYASYSMFKRDSFPLTSAEQHRGNWSLSITPGSTGSKDAESVSSFALSDFDFGESDVDEIRAADDDDDDEDTGEEGKKCADNAMHDVLL